MAEIWIPANSADLPERFNDPACEDFRTRCSNGFVGDISICSALMHKPQRWPQCFPDGHEGDAACTSFFERRIKV